MTDFIKVPTTREVWRAIKAAHALRLYSSFSDPTGTFQGGPGEVGVMETGYSLNVADDFPILFARTTWQIKDDGTRHNEKDEFWLCIGKKDEE